ncbi:MAG: glycosyltransferase [Coprobacillus sp.]|nr:glycosyltransferase [Coprobacillus sp.]
MNVTIIADIYGVPNNGTVLAAYNLINTLKAHGHNVKVVCCDQLSQGKEGYYVVDIRSFGPFNHYVSRNSVVLAKRALSTIEEACKDADIVHSMVPFRLGKEAARYCYNHDIPFTSGFHVQAENFSSHFFIMRYRSVNHLVYRYYWRLYYRYCTAIHFPTEFIRDLAWREHIRGPKPYVISNGVQLDLFYPVPDHKKPPYLKDKFVITMSGRLTKEKNQITLIRAIKKSKYKNSIQVILCGDGPCDVKLLRAGKSLPYQPIIRHFPHEELNEILRSSDLYVHASNVEIEAISCLEAIACGTVPIISNSPKSATKNFALCPESLFKSKNPTDLAKRIDWWISHPVERKKMSEKYAEFGKQFDFNACMEQMNDFLIDVKENYKPGNLTWLKKKKKKK